MDKKISVVINTLNESEQLKRALNSLKWADEIVVCDMNSTDDTVSIAKKAGAKVIFHEKLSFVEPARNFAVAKATGDWILILDPDEEIPETLSEKLKELASNSKYSFVRVPRKNLIFNKWMKQAMWWPDYNLRFFRKGTVKWSGQIHIQPETTGEGLDLEIDEKYAIIHHHYTSVTQYLERLNRYTTIQAEELYKKGIKFSWKDLLNEPAKEFFGRYFANKGFEDGLHGLALCLLQAFSHLIVYLKLWELEKFAEQKISLLEVQSESSKLAKDFKYWFTYSNLSKNQAIRVIQKIKHKISQ